MQFSKVKDIFKDWVRGGFRFGNTFSNYIAGRLDASPSATRFGGGMFDLAAGAGVTLMAATSALGTLAGAVAAVSAVATAPVSALVTLATGVVWLALATGMGGIGLGLLDAARQKAGIARPTALLRGARTGVTGASAAVQNVFRKGAEKLKARFNTAAPAQQPAPQPTRRSDVDFTL